MVASRFIVRHGSCALCQKPAKLYSLHLEAGSEPDIFFASNPATTHTGLCPSCWRRICAEIGKAFLGWPKKRKGRVNG